VGNIDREVSIMLFKNLLPCRARNKIYTNTGYEFRPKFSKGEAICAALEKRTLNGRVWEIRYSLRRPLQRDVSIGCRFVSLD